MSPADLQARKGDLRALAQRALVAREVTDNGATFTFRNQPDIESAVRDFARLEKECCPFFDFRIDVLPDAIRVTVDAPPEARPMLEGLFETLSTRCCG